MRPPKTPPNRPTPEQIDEFAGYIAKWQRLLGLTDWRIEKSKRKTSAMADVKVTYDARMASWAIGDFGTAEINSNTLEQTACHELLHVRLYEFWHLTVKEVDEDTLASAEHAVITVLEKLLVPHLTTTPPSQGITAA